MTAYPLTPVRYRALDKNGLPLIGGQVFAYEAGSTTAEKDTYSDKSMENLNTWPVILDDAGSASIYISGDYFFQVFDAEGNLIEEGDGIADAESIAQALIDGNSGGAANLEQRVTDLETARDEHTDQINDLIDDTNQLRTDLDKEVETDRDAAILVAVNAAKAALTESFDEQIADVIAQFDAELNKLKIPIDGIHISFSNVNPSTTLGYGTWQLASKGRAIVGLSDVVSDPNWTKTIGSTYGENEHILTIAEMPEHGHKLAEASGTTGGSGAVDANSTIVDPGNDQAIGKTGGGQAHNNVQPSMVLAIWKRTA